jgi:hypothetical protein
MNHTTTDALVPQSCAISCNTSRAERAGRGSTMYSASALCDSSVSFASGCRIVSNVISQASCILSHSLLLSLPCSHHAPFRNSAALACIVVILSASVCRILSTSSRGAPAVAASSRPDPRSRVSTPDPRSGSSTPDLGSRSHTARSSAAGPHEPDLAAGPPRQILGSRVLRSWYPPQHLL